MAASNQFVEDLLDIIDEHISAFKGNNEAKLKMALDVSNIPASNQSVRVTQQRIRAAAMRRWS